jgi:alpha,alpha-trehalase
LEGVCADLATVDLNSLLYKYEADIAKVIHTEFNDKLMIPPEFSVPGHAHLKHGAVSSSAAWDRRAKLRKKLLVKYLWNDEKGMFFDYNTVKKQQSTYESATTFWAMWAGAMEPRHVHRMVETALKKFEGPGGLASGTKESRGELGIDRPNRQWDYP